MDEMLSSFVDRIAGLAVAANGIDEFKIDGRDYTDAQLVPVKPPLEEVLHLNTLAAVVEVAKQRADEAVVLVASHREVLVVSKKLDGWRQRARIAKADLSNYESHFPFGQAIDHESFIIALQANFKREPALELLLKVASNLTAEATATSKDDGVSQEVGLRAGVVLQERAALPNPVFLRPFRTFREIEQPASSFVFRAHGGGEGKAPGLSLREADGGTWKLEAINGIASFLREKLGDSVPVIA